MRNYICGILIIIGAVFMVSCKGGSEKVEKDFLTNTLEQLKIDQAYEWVVILPGLGCHGCIQEGEFFMKKNISNTKILFVLTNISSLKILQQKIGIKINDHHNIFVDRDNRFKLPTENAIYPCIIQVKNGEILQYAFQSPNTAAFHNMKKYLK